MQSSLNCACSVPATSLSAGTGIAAVSLAAPYNYPVFSFFFCVCHSPGRRCALPVRVGDGRSIFALASFRTAAGIWDGCSGAAKPPGEVAIT